MDNTNNKLTRWGEHIGGSAKEIRGNSLDINSLVKMNKAERLKYVKKNSIWKTPKYEELVKDGLKVEVAYFIKLVKDSLPITPSISVLDDEKTIKDKQDRYFDFVNELKEMTMNLKTEEDIVNFYSKFKDKYLEQTSKYSVELKPNVKDCFNNKLLDAIQTNIYFIKRDIEKKQFCYSEEQKILAPYDFIKYDKDNVSFTNDAVGRTVIEHKTMIGKSFYYPKDEFADSDKYKENTYIVLKDRRIIANNFDTIEEAKSKILSSEKVVEVYEKKSETSNRKKKFTPEHLENINYKGPNFRKGKDIEGQDYLEKLNFKGGEFGNWLNDKERQINMNMAFEAFSSLALALNIKDADISLNKRLSMAFGSRGSGSALAHYEPLREVINLTKMNGAGSLAHEWGHAMDDILNKSITGKAMDQRTYKDITEIQSNLIHNMKYKTVKVLNEENIEQNKINEIEILKSKEKIMSYLNKVLPKDAKLKPEQIKEKNDLVEKVINDKTINFNYIFKDSTEKVKSIEDLSLFCKKITNHKLNKDKCKEINKLVSILNNRYKDATIEQETKRVETDFCKDSQTFDSSFSKEKKGYWASDEEMFARAFACYVDDKLKEQNITCDYLVGHANKASAVLNDKKVIAYPVGEEREVINKEFDKLINHFKELGLLNEREVVAEKTLDIDRDKETEKSLIKEDNSMKSTYKQLSLNFDR